MTDGEEALHRKKLVLPDAVLAALESASRQKSGVVLFSGSFGTDKMMAAQALAERQGRSLQRVDLAQIVSKYLGEAAKQLSHVFAEAASAGAVIFFDEADALFGKRSEVRDSHDRYANIEVAALLEQIERYPGLVILATNERDRIDKAFLRRVKLDLPFPPPGKTDRKSLWR